LAGEQKKAAYRSFVWANRDNPEFAAARDFEQGQAALRFAIAAAPA
jgi:hypothetical protein